MEVRRHQAKGMGPILEAFNTFLKQQKKTPTVSRIEEDILAAIATKNDVINGPGIMKSRFTWYV